MYSKKEKSWNKIHLISTDQKDTPKRIILTYKIRWRIETFHRDIKQNLGFAKAYFRKGTGIVRHSIFVIIAYIVLRLFMFRKGLDMTIGECCEYLQDKNLNCLVQEVVEIENKSARNSRFEEVFIRGSGKV